MDGTEWYSRDYAQARDRFRAAATAAGAVLYGLPLVETAPDGGPLSIDIAWLGARTPRRLLLHSSGLHGVEGYAGAAVQLGLLAGPPPGTDTALVLVHALNPWGMAWRRRVNEHNVDLNRNLLPPGEAWSGAPAGYARLNGLLNPTVLPVPDAFYLRALGQVLRHGYRRLKQAVAIGQYTYPRGLFYGGARLEPGPAAFGDWLAQHLCGVERVLAVDVHTGLGAWGRESLFLETRAGTGAGDLGSALDRLLLPVTDDPAAGYANRGGYGCWLPGRLPRARVDVITQEFGTWPGLRMLRALRAENCAYHAGRRDPADPVRLTLLAGFCPPQAAWRRAVVERGLSLAGAALTALDAGA